MLRLFLFLLFSVQTYALAEVHMSSEERREAYDSLQWQEAGTYHLSNSHSILHLEGDYFILLGEEAQKERALAGDAPDANIEAVIYCPETQSSIIVKNIPTGYVSSICLSNLNANSLLDPLKRQTEGNNPYRIQQNCPSIHVVGWFQEPQFDPESKTLFWITEGSYSHREESFFNYAFLKLNRYGYLSFTLVAEKENFTYARQELEDVVASHQFEIGSRYEDFEYGDKTAYGLISAQDFFSTLFSRKALDPWVKFKNMSALLIGGLLAVLAKRKKFPFSKQLDCY